ncbi:MAG: hypothetical protein EBR58_02490 [Betaproteobacteria bacterium]|nr:hypothetical protein [Betaproteobacteria bacterium]
MTNVKAATDAMATDAISAVIAAVRIAASHATKPAPITVASAPNGVAAMSVVNATAVVNAQSAKTVVTAMNAASATACPVRSAWMASSPKP